MTDPIHALVLAVTTLADVRRNDDAYTYVIRGFDGSPYITRTMFPRVGDVRALLHQIHRDDQDPHPHNHPWRWAKFRVVAGGYTDERWLPNGDLVRITRRPDSNAVNVLTCDAFHRAVDVLPGTVTFGIVGERVQGWGFLVDGVVVPHAEYFARKGHAVEFGGRS